MIEAEESLNTIIRQSEQLVKEMKHLTDRLEKQLNKAIEQKDNYSTFCEIQEFRSMVSFSNPRYRYLDKTIGVLQKIRDEFERRGEDGFESFSL